MSEKTEGRERIEGTLQVTPGGRGFVDRGEAFEDVLVQRRDLGLALDGDLVEVETWPGRHRMVGRITAVLERGRTRVTGNLIAGVDGTPLLQPDDVRLPAPMPVSDTGEARVGQAVLGEIVAYPEREGELPEVRVDRVLGEPDRLITEVAKAVVGAGVDEPLPRAVRAAARSVAQEVRLDEEELAHRTDLRHLHFVTIDPLSARDFDDAVALEDLPDGGGARVWVAVADVSHYVQEGSALDKEARRRGCSIYLPDRAIHMLPEELSAGICSLVPDEDRLAMVVRLDVADDGSILEEDCLAAVIHSRGRLDYGGVAAALQGDFRGKRAGYVEHAGILERLGQVTGALRAARLKRGSLDLDLPESQVQLDEDDPNRVRDIISSRGDEPVKKAYNLIEELMVSANEAVARRFQALKIPTIWRVHPRPTTDRVEQLGTWLSAYGVQIDPADLVTPRGMGRVLTALADHPSRRPLSYLVLRTLKQAVYAVNNVGHFGLASRTYLHFTSPIRRYPDLHVHRLVKAMLSKEGKPSGGARPVRARSAKELKAMAKGATQAEQRAVALERDVRRLYSAALMRDRIGTRLEGQITGVIRDGFFAALDHPAVEGMVRLQRRDAQFHGDQMRLKDRHRGVVYGLGDRVVVEVVDTNTRRRRIDLKLADEEGAHTPVTEPPELEDTRSHRGKGNRKGKGKGQKKYYEKFKKRGKGRRRR